MFGPTVEQRYMWLESKERNVSRWAEAYRQTPTPGMKEELDRAIASLRDAEASHDAWVDRQLGIPQRPATPFDVAYTLIVVVAAFAFLIAFVMRFH